MYKYFLFLISLFLSTQLKAQQTAIHIFVENGLETSSTLQVYSLPDSIVLYSLVVRDSVTLEVEGKRSYILRLSNATAFPLERVINVEQVPLTIYLSTQARVSSLETIVVTAKKPLITQDGDKQIVDAEVLSASSSNALEVLEKTPGAIVDQDGNVYLSSATPATVYINGREMKLSSADLASLLKSLPANSISKIEILRTPSAKYDAASSGGIINIVLKKGVKLGLNGSVNASYFQGKKSDQSVGFNLNKGNGKWNSFISYQFTKAGNFEELISDRKIKTDVSLLKQSANTRYLNHNQYLGGGTDYAISKRWNVAYDGSFSFSNKKSTAQNDNNIFDAAGSKIASNRSDIGNDGRSIYVGNTLSSKYKIDSLGSELTAEVNYNYFENNGGQQYTNLSVQPVFPTTRGNGTTANKKHIFAAQTDLTYKLPFKITVEAGLKTATSNSSNSTAYDIAKGSAAPVVDSFQTNTFKYDETISAAYLQVSKNIAGFTLKPGFRLEGTEISGRQIIPKDTSFSIKRTDLFPYVYLSHKLFKIFGNDLIANLIFRKSIKRPYYEALNPYPQYVDQYLFERGNPALRPQFTTNYEFNVTYSGFPVAALGVNDTKDIFTNVTYQDDVTKIAYRTYDNLGKNKEVYGRLLGGIPPGGKFFFYAGAQYNQNMYDGQYQGKALNYKRSSWTFFMYQEMKFSKTFSANMQGFLRTKGLQNFYELDNFGGLYLSLNKDVLRKKGTITLSMRDVFYTNKVNFSLDQGDVRAQGSRANDSRRVGLKLRYNFGVKRQTKQNKGFGAPVEGL